jgi:hypothetical protein
MKLVLGGSGSSSSSKHKEHHSTSSSPPPRPTASSQQYSHGQYGQGQYSSQYEEPAKSPEQERAEYLASLDQRRGVHVAGVGAPSSHGYASGGHREEEGEDVPTAPVLVSPVCHDTMLAKHCQTTVFQTCSQRLLLLDM